MPDAPVRKLSRRKRLFFLLCAAALGGLLIEGLSWGVVNFLEHTYGTTTRRQQLEIVRSGNKKNNEAESIHPYLGWIFNPQLNQGSELFGRKIPVNSLGFNDEEHGVVKRGPNRFVVAITGGSVAWQVSVAGEETLRKALLEHPRLQGQEIEIVRLAMSGYKQPQQLMALNYALTLGYEFDLVINVDGYNEIALAACENAMSGVFTAYPRAWQIRVQSALDPQNYQTAWRLLQLRGLRQEIARGRLESWFSWSSTLDLIWWARTKSIDTELIQLGEQLRDRQVSSGLGFAAVGPEQKFPEETGMYANLVSIWSNTSLQMHRLCHANDCLYLHVLQPNQYLPGSKPLTQMERDKMVDLTQDYGKSIVKGYPLLITEGQSLRERGVQFHDLTQLFAEVSDEIYLDPFCHYNERGNELLARSIAREVARLLDRKE